MAQQVLNVGSAANDGTGDPLRTAGGKINDNFTEVYSRVATLEGQSGGGGTVTPEQFGAFGDGGSHPLSSVYGTLAAAQEVYPAATSLTQQIDYCAVIKAINTLIAAGGGTLSLGPKQYIMTASGGTVADQIILPVANPDSRTGTPIRIIGTGRHASKLIWNRSIGSLQFAIHCGNPSGTRANSLGRYAEGNDGKYAHLLQDFAVVGSESFASRSTTSSFTMSGVALGSKCAVVRVVVANFHHGFSIVGDWTWYQDAMANSCYFGFYWAEMSQFLYGDLSFAKCTSGGHQCAAIGVHPNAYITADFEGCFFGTSPYGIFKETAGGSQDIMFGCTFTNCLFEGTANGMIWDEGATIGAKRGVLATRFINLHYNPYAGAGIAGRSLVAVISCGNFWMNTFDGIKNPYFWTNADSVPTTALIQCNGIREVTFNGGLSYLAEAAMNNGIPFFDPDIPDISGAHTCRWYDGMGHGGEGIFLEVSDSSTAIARYDLVELVGNFACRPCQTENNNPVAGVAVMSGAVYHVIPVATSGRSLPVKRTPVITVNTPIKKGAAGSIAAATATTDEHYCGYYVGDEGGFARIALRGVA